MRARRDLVLSLAFALVAPLLMGATVFIDGSGSVGDVVGPGSSVDNRIVRMDSTTGKVIQQSTATIDDSGNLSANSVATTDSDGTNGIELYGNPSKDVTAPSGDNLKLFTDAVGGLYAKRPADGSGAFTLASGAGRVVKIGRFSYAADPGGSTQATLVDQNEDDAASCISRSINQIVIACPGTYRFVAAAWWEIDRATVPNFAGGVYWYDDTNTISVDGSAGSYYGCGGAPFEAEYVVTSTGLPWSFSIYPARCDPGTLGGVSGEHVNTDQGRYRIERVR